MTRLARQFRAEAAARDMLYRTMANRCEAEAERGRFRPVGHRCNFCLHTIPGGCRLRVLARQAMR